MTEQNKRIIADADGLADVRTQAQDLELTVSSEEKAQRAKREQEIHGWRKRVLVGLSVFLGIWSIFTFVSIFFLPESVAIALLTSTLAQVVGLTAIAFKWLFPREK